MYSKKSDGGYFKTSPVFSNTLGLIKSDQPKFNKYRNRKNCTRKKLWVTKADNTQEAETFTPDVISQPKVDTVRVLEVIDLHVTKPAGLEYYEKLALW